MTKSYEPRYMERVAVLSGKTWNVGYVLDTTSAPAVEVWECAHVHKFPDMALACARKQIKILQKQDQKRQEEGA